MTFHFIHLLQHPLCFLFTLRIVTASAGGLCCLPQPRRVIKSNFRLVVGCREPSQSMSFISQENNNRNPSLGLGEPTAALCSGPRSWLRLLLLPVSRSCSGFCVFLLLLEQPSPVASRKHSLAFTSASPPATISQRGFGAAARVPRRGIKSRMNRDSRSYLQSWMPVIFHSLPESMSSELNCLLEECFQASCIIRHF